MPNSARKPPTAASPMIGASFETVSTRPSKRRAKLSHSASEAVRARFDVIFPRDFIARDFAKALLSKFRNAEASERARLATSVIEDLLKLERHCYANCVVERAAFFAQAKKEFASEILEAVASRMEADVAYRRENQARWMGWVLSKGFSDISDFWFWSGWHDRLELV